MQTNLAAAENFEVSFDDAIAAAVGMDAADRDKDGRFPAAAFAALRDHGLIARPPLADAEAGLLFRILATVGRGDLSVGRIFEGHVNALWLIRRFGTASQREHYQKLACQGDLFGVWNTDMPDEGLRLEGMRLRGKKSFASGVDGLSHALVTAAGSRGRLMLLVPLVGTRVDRSWWQPLGMRASGSHIVDFTGLDVKSDWFLGGDNDYLQEPWFSAGAVRFAAVHVGGMHALFDAAVTHLQRTKRIENPHQRHRVARMGISVESGYALLDRASEFWLEAATVGMPSAAGSRMVSMANATRLAIESLALAVLDKAERAVGAAGMIAPHPLERLLRDLRTYLKQPNPDGALTSLGSSIANGIWAPGRRFARGKRDAARL
jgi:alkylation response protein AidB-like acyl-CoA dehydrogenase